MINILHFLYSIFRVNYHSEDDFIINAKEFDKFSYYNIHLSIYKY